LLTAPLFLANAVIGFSNSSDFDNARAMVSFTCK
jgi:hypothetical protein